MKKTTSLKASFWKFLCMLLIGLIGAVAIPFSLILAGTSTGLITYANYSERITKNLAPVIAATPDLADVQLPMGCKYLVLDKNYQVTETTLEGDDLDRAMEYAISGKINTNLNKQYLLVTRENEYVVLQYYIGSQFTNEWLYEHFPSPEILLYIFIAINCIAVCVILAAKFMSGGILQRELWEEAEKFLIQREIYDVILAEEQDLREYKQTLLDSGNYTKKQVKEQSSALRKIQKYWIETEYGELLLEIRESQVSDEALKGNIKRFLIRQGIHHIKEIDYTVRSRYEAELKKMWDEASVMRYLKVFDHIKQYSIQKEIESLPGRIEHRRKYQAQVVFLPYLSDLELVKDFEYVRDKQELVWDFFRRASEKLKKQVFLLLNYILDNLYRDDPKERRVRYLLPLHWLYDFCVEEEIDDLEGLELEQIQRFEKIVEQKVVNVKNSMQIIDNSRKILFLTAPEIHWHANVWYMERFHLSEDRLNPSNPVQRLSFIEVTNKKNRELLQEYAKYHVGIGGLTIANIRGQLYEVKRLLEYFKEEESICQVDENQLDDYFRKLEEKDTKDDTFNKRIVHYIKFYQFLNVRGYMKEIPFKPEYYLKKTYPEHHDRTVEEKVYMEILHKLYAFPLVPRLIFLHLWCTGLRISEVCTLKGDAYYWDGEDAWLKVYQIKMKADKMIPIPLVMYRIMRKYIEREHIRPKDYIFKGKDGGAYRGTTFRQEFQQYCDKNGIADGSYIFKTHDYRHTLATQFYDEDVSIQTIRDYLGHFSEEMTKQYVDFMPKRIEKASDTYFKKPENDLASTIKAKKRGERK